MKSHPPGNLASTSSTLLTLTVVAALAVACGGAEADGPPGGRGGQSRGGGGFPGGGFPGGGFGADPSQSAAIPVEVAEVTRRDIADLLETTGTLEAEQEVDVVARITGPIVELRAEEGDRVRAGDLLARIDDRELRARLQILEVTLEEARANYERAKVSFGAQVISQETLDQTKARFESAAAQIRGTEIELGYTSVTAPFDGLVIGRAIKYQEFVQNGGRLFRVSDFDPLLCPIQIPEKDLSRVRLDQSAFLTVEAFPGERFGARVLRINPVVDRESGTVKVTLAVDGRDRLRPGMFASVNLRTDVHAGATVIPKRALVLESIGDTVYVFEDGVARRREIEIGFEESDVAEVLSGLAPGERVLVVGQDSVSDGTPVYVLAEAGSAQPTGGGVGAESRGAGGGAPGGPRGPQAGTGEGRGNAPSGGPPPGGGARPGPGGFREIDWNDPQAVERVKARMRERGMSDAQIEQTIERMKTMGPGARPGGS
jgi:membrane fusion protein (multidrug efflux system)